MTTTNTAPAHRIDVRPGSQHVEIQIAGETIADSRRPLVLEETRCPVRFYLPRQDVRLDRLSKTATHTHCPYKGDASYWSVRVGDGLEEAVVWSYTAPDDDAKRIKGLYAFYDERVDVEVDGESGERPRTQWHAEGW